MYKFEKLSVWRKVLDLIKDVYAFSSTVPSLERSVLIDQLRRSVTSVALNIAEGSGAGTDVEYKRYLLIAKKSLFETVANLKILHHLYGVDVTSLESQIDEVSRMLTSLVKYLKSQDSRPKPMHQIP